MPQQYDITNGPNKSLLQAALFEGSASDRIPIVFFIKIGEEISPRSFHINQIQREDGSGECWNFEGDQLSNGGRLRIPAKGFFSTRSLQGHVVF